MSPIGNLSLHAWHQLVGLCETAMPQAKVSVETLVKMLQVIHRRFPRRYLPFPGRSWTNTVEDYEKVHLHASAAKAEFMLLGGCTGREQQT